MQNEWYENLETFFRRSYEREALEAVRKGKGFIVVNFKKLERFSPELADELLDRPEEFLDEGRRALNQIDLPSHKQPKLEVRICGLPDSRSERVRDLRSQHLGKFLRISGVVRWASEVKPEIERGKFICQGCGHQFWLGRVNQTKSIKCESCRKRKATCIDREFTDLMVLKFEDPFEETMGEQPGELKVHLRKDLTTPEIQSLASPGSKLEITGILKGKPSKGGTYDFYFEANWLKPVEEVYEEFKLSNEEIKKFKELSTHPRLYERLCSSIAPSMWGLKEIKEAILLFLFGGNEYFLPDGIRIRGDIHILLVGDPATGKTQLLKQVAQIIPKGRYTSGKGVSGAGLTATVVKDKDFGGWILEAGTLVLSHRGAVCIDEFGKVSEEDQINMHEAMSKGTVSIDKASISTTLPAQTAILAGANPKFFRFDPGKPIADQITIPETLLSRFDLKFPLRDIPDPKKDEQMVDHLIKARLKKEKVKPLVKPGLLRKYIAYARQQCNPSLTKPALEKLKEFYLELRKKTGGEDLPTISITPRQYEALLRLTQASAKVRLAEKVTKEDAERAIRLMRSSMRQLGIDPETGKIDIDRVEGGIPSSRRSKMSIISDSIKSLEEKSGKTIDKEELITALAEESIKREEAKQIIRQMKKKGLLYEPTQGKIERI